MQQRPPQVNKNVYEPRQFTDHSQRLRHLALLQQKPPQTLVATQPPRPQPSLPNLKRRNPQAKPGSPAPSSDPSLVSHSSGSSRGSASAARSAPRPLPEYHQPHTHISLNPQHLLAQLRHRNTTRHQCSSREPAWHPLAWPNTIVGPLLSHSRP